MRNFTKIDNLCKVWNKAVSKKTYKGENTNVQCRYYKSCKCHGIRST